jgi:hypothetical protein
MIWRAPAAFYRDDAHTSLHPKWAFPSLEEPILPSLVNLANIAKPMKLRGGERHSDAFKFKNRAPDALGIQGRDEFVSANVLHGQAHHYQFKNILEVSTEKGLLSTSHILSWKWSFAFFVSSKPNLFKQRTALSLGGKSHEGIAVKAHLRDGKPGSGKGSRGLSQAPAHPN